MRYGAARRVCRLAGISEPAVTSTSTWSYVRKGIANDPRCKALPELRRRCARLPCAAGHNRQRGSPGAVQYRLCAWCKAWLAGMPSSGTET